MGKTPYTDTYLITKLLSLRLPLFPQLQVRISTRLSSELTHGLLGGTLDLAFLTSVPDTARLTGSLVTEQSLWVAMLEEDELARTREVEFESLRSRSCILFERHVQPSFYDEFIHIVHPASTPGCSLHHVMTAEDALQLILRGFGIAILNQAGAWRIPQSGVTIRPLRLAEVKLQTRLVARADNESKVLSGFVRGFVRSLVSLPPVQFQLPLSG